SGRGRSGRSRSKHPPVVPNPGAMVGRGFAGGWEPFLVDQRSVGTPMSEVLGLLVGFILTLFIYSYIVGDNVLYRLAVHVLVGITAAYALVIAVQRVFLPVFQQLRENPTDPANVWLLVPLLFALLLVLKLVRPVAWLGNKIGRASR